MSNPNFCRSVLSGQPVDGAPVSQNLSALAHALHGMMEAGEFRRAPTATRTRLRGAILTLEALATQDQDEEIARHIDALREPGLWHRAMAWLRAGGR